MSCKDFFDLIQIGSRLTLGMGSTLLEMLQGQQSLEASATQQNLVQLIQELEKKGKKIEKNSEQFLKIISPSIPYSSSNYPFYIERGGEQSYPPPGVLKNYQLYGFFIEGSLPTLQKLCDNYLNKPTKGKTDYRPVTNMVLVTFGKSSNVISTPQKNRGIFEETEAAFWVLTMVGKQIGPFFFMDHLAWFMPYVFVDSPYIMVTGREVFGYPKGLGNFNWPESSSRSEIFSISDELSVESMVLKEFTPDTKTTKEKLIEISRIPNDTPSSNPRDILWNDLNDVIKDIASIILENDGMIKIPDLNLDLSLLDCLTGDVEVPMVFLKQFRDVKYSERACYQAIVEAPTKLINFRQGNLLSNKNDSLSDLFNVKVSEYDSHPIVRELGLAGGGEQIAKAAFWLDFDFTYQLGQEIWKAT